MSAVLRGGFCLAGGWGMENDIKGADWKVLQIREGNEQKIRSYFYFIYDYDDCDCDFEFMCLDDDLEGANGRKSSLEIERNFERKHLTCSLRDGVSALSLFQK